MNLKNCLWRLISTKTNQKFLIDGFSNGFDLGYEGPRNLQRRAPNLKLRVGNETVLWNKIMKEVKKLRFAGPFSEVPFMDFIQSPVGLVPKDGGKETRLIFHLSYPCNGLSINSATPAEICKVNYPDFLEAIKLCIQEGKFCFLSKSDMTSAFRNLCMNKRSWPLLIIIAKSPIDGKTYFFVDKCLPFGASISCSHFQRFSNVVAHIVKVKGGHPLVNYLDDYLFVMLLRRICDEQTRLFLSICERIGFPVSMEKTVWSTTILVFLGLLIDSISQTVSIPEDKVSRAILLIENMLSKTKTTVKHLQKLTGFLNFICRCIIPGRAFTRRLYSFVKPNMMAHHHVRINREMREDLNMWIKFLRDPGVYCRPFLDFSQVLMADELQWTTDASGTIGVGGTWDSHWFYGFWHKTFLSEQKPSIEYQELFGVMISIYLWGKHFRNKRICLLCDNQGVVAMINNSTSSCKNCMVLIRKITLVCLTLNLRVFASYISTKDNFLSDSLSRGRILKFREQAIKAGREINDEPTGIPEEIWPAQKLWLYQ